MCIGIGEANSEVGRPLHGFDILVGRAVGGEEGGRVGEEGGGGERDVEGG